MKRISALYDKTIKRICGFLSLSLVQICSFLMYKIIVDIVYLLFMSKHNDFGININVLNIVSGYLSVLFFSYFICKYSYCNNASSLMMIIINMVYFIPITTYCSLGPGSNGFFFWTIIYWTLLSVLQIKIPIVVLSGTKREIGNIFFYFLLISMTVLTLYISFKYTGFRIITNMSDIYEIRAEASKYDFSPWLSYLQHFSTILIPMLILMAFYKKNYFGVITGLFLLLLNFSFAGHKTVLFMGVFLILGYLFWRNEMNSLLLPGGICVGILAIIEQVVFKHGFIVSLFFRRQGFLLAQLSDEYYRFFMKNPTDLFRKTFLGKLGFESQYALAISKVLGNNYATQNVSYNNGLLADVWTHLGIVGIFIMPFILIICFRVLDLVTDKLDMRFLVGLIIYYAIIFTNTTWSTVLLTHGFLIMCIVFFMFPRNKI